MIIMYIYIYILIMYHQNIIILLIQSLPVGETRVRTCPTRTLVDEQGSQANNWLRCSLTASDSLAVISPDQNCAPNIFEWFINVTAFLTKYNCNKCMFHNNCKNLKVDSKELLPSGELT